MRETEIRNALGPGSLGILISPLVPMAVKRDICCLQTGPGQQQLLLLDEPTNHLDMPSGKSWNEPAGFPAPSDDIPRQVFPE